ncbi:ABC transporter substrate-binding protein [Limnochorda pilosa]|uniref:ABC transporter substrate-binding protein n=1 Tax=Limnochorda pilosa TaxID=1555112 RepID=A0A0K2SLN3_LIMPI|nr:sugar ABC transporter substrate-binding protein [Limnochorda pilosa]BAS28036.1 ABC transporter substrate-binding protein [Limnochorda pilosa]
MQRLGHWLAVAVAVVIIAGCTIGVAAQDSLSGTKVTVALRSLSETDYIVSRLAEFEKQTGIDVTVVTYAEQQLREKEVQDLSTGAGQFDVVAIDSVFIPEFAQAGWLVPLAPYLDPEYDLADIPDSVHGLFSWNDVLYAAPVYAEITQLMYRKDLFEKEGIAVPTIFEELEEAAAHFTRPPNLYGLAMRGLRGNGMNVYTWATWFRAFGGEFLDEQSRPIFNNAAGVKATEEYARLLQEYGPPGVAGYSWDNVQTAFTSGRVAMIIDANNFYTRIEDPDKSAIAGNIGYAVVPAGPEGSFPGNYALGFAISSVGARSDVEKKAAAAFISWATSAQMQMDSLEAGIVSQTRTSVLESPEFARSLHPEWIASTVESWEITNPNHRPLFPGWRSMGDAIGIAVQQVIAGERPAQEALNEAVKTTEDLFKRTGDYGKPRPYEF